MDVNDSIVGGKDCVGAAVDTVCVVNAVATDGVICVDVVTDPLCVDGDSSGAAMFRDCTRVDIAGPAHPGLAF